MPFTNIGIVGAGSTGSMMAFAFADLGLAVSVWDVDASKVDNINKHAGDAKAGSVAGFKKIGEFADSLDGSVADEFDDDRPRPRLYMFSTPHGEPADSVIEELGGHLHEGDVIMDGGNEHYRNSQRRQRDLRKKGIFYVGMGVSGGYQAARQGPSLSPGGDEHSLAKIMPLLDKYAARDKKTGRACVAGVGPGGSGHYIKMVHNGIEQGMMSVLCEAWALMRTGLEMGEDEIGDLFAKWNEEGELRNTFLVEIGVQVCKERISGGGKNKTGGGHVLERVLDKVVQDDDDDDDSEGTGHWAIMDAAARHVSAPTIAAGHFMRVASGNRAQRVKVAKHLQLPQPGKLANVVDRAEFVEKLRLAVHVGFLCSFCQGLELVARASRDESWHINLSTCIRIWRGGCIIQCESIADMLETILHDAYIHGTRVMNIKLVDEVAAALRRGYPALRDVVLRAGESDNAVPALSASLEYLKYEGSKSLPTQFMEAELDLFGAHGFDRPGVEGEDPGRTRRGRNHYEWRPVG